jgi:hypothetical protein
MLDSFSKAVRSRRNCPTIQARFLRQSEGRDEIVNVGDHAISVHAKDSVSTNGTAFVGALSGALVQLPNCVEAHAAGHDRQTKHRKPVRPASDYPRLTFFEGTVTKGRDRF